MPLFFLTFLSIIMLSFSIPAYTLAQGEQYAWVNGNKIQISGGSVVGTLTLNYVAPGQFSTQNGRTYTGGMLIVHTDKYDCQMSISIYVANNNLQQGIITAGAGSSMGSSGPVKYLTCSNDVINQFNKKTITLSGTPQGDLCPNETDDQKGVHINISAPDGAAAPATLTVKVNNTLTLTAQKTISKDTGSAMYTTGFVATPGDYQVCATPVVACTTFTKIKCQPKTISLGDSNYPLIVNLTVKVAAFSLQSCNIGPYDIALKKNGATVTTIKSDSTKTTPPKGAEMTLGNDANDVTAQLHATFPQVGPGTYQVCVDKLKVCKDFVYDRGVIRPQVDITANEPNSAAICLAAGNSPPPSDPPSPPSPPCIQGGWANGQCKGLTTALGNLQTNPGEFITRVFAILLSFSGGIALLLIIRAGYVLMTSQGKPDQVQSGRDQLIAAVVGLAFLIFSLVILQVIGLDILHIPGFK